MSDRTEGMVMTTIPCDDCDRPATETWDYSHAPIPNPPAPGHLCEQCADVRRDSWES